MSCTSYNEGPLGAWPNSVISAPAIKVLPSQIITIDFTSSFLIADPTPSFNPSLTFAERAFTGGEFKVTTATSSFISKVVTSLMVVIIISF